MQLVLLAEKYSYRALSLVASNVGSYTALTSAERITGPEHIYIYALGVSLRYDLSFTYSHIASCR